MQVLSDTLRTVRRKAGLTEIQAAARMGISQSYLAMLERGQRRVTAPLARKFRQLYQLSPALLPLPGEYTPNQGVDAQSLATQLASLDYPGFAYLGQGPSELHPAKILLDGLAHDELEARMVEALPWLLIRYWEMDMVWLIRQAKLSDLQNRLGFTATLARRALENSAVPNAEREAALKTLESDLAGSRLAKEDTFMKRVNEQEREWLRESRSQEARFWNLLTDWHPEHLSYVL
jgi:transcriptional regulator with XRE-family HTH domain